MMRYIAAFGLSMILMPVFGMIVQAQSPSPETAPPLFPKGALISYGSNFLTRDRESEEISSTSQPTFLHQGNFTFTWGFYPNFDVTVAAPIITEHFKTDDHDLGGTGYGDTMVLLKYRFYRDDSPRGTHQMSVTAGPKIPTGKTDLKTSTGNLLPATLQPGSGSADLFFGLSWTYTGLFGIRRLVANNDFHSLIRTTGTQGTKLGSDFESRFWLSYRPYESEDVSKEWFIGPTLSWSHSQEEQVSGIKQIGSGGDVLFLGLTTYVGVAPGLHLWLGWDTAITHSSGANFTAVRRHVTFGITRQFRFF